MAWRRATARFDGTGRYRYELTRAWGDGPLACWIMLNPSTADATRDDPTIRRCVAFSRDRGFGSLVVVNLFALRATRPGELASARDPVGPGNDGAISRAVRRSDEVVVAWGRHAALLSRGERLLRMLAGTRLLALGVNRDATPRHPLYVRASTSFIRFDQREALA